MNQNNQFSIAPTAKQADFVLSPKKFSCFSGGFGNGKTTAGCLKAIALSQYPNNFGLIGRLTYPELRDTTQRSFFELCPPEYYDKEHGGEYRRSEEKVRFSNGSEVIFRHLDTVSEKELLSLNLGWFYIDQAEEIGERVFLVLQSRLRKNDVPRRYGFVTCNPEPGNWIYQRFKKPFDEGTLSNDYHYVSATTMENPHLPADYVPTLLESYPEELVKRYIEGQWEVFEGQIYPEFHRESHVIKPFKIPQEWEKIVAIDYGMVNPTCALWAAIDYDGNVFIYDEYYQAGVVSQHAEAILEKSKGQEIKEWFIDPSTASKTREKEGMPWSVLEEFEDYGLYPFPANRERLAGINRIKEFLRLDNNRRNPLTNEQPAPRLYIFATCTNLLWEFPQYQWRKMRGAVERNAPEAARDFNDHAMDALRYIIMSRFPPPTKKVRGDELATPRLRHGDANFDKPFPKGMDGDEMFGQFGDTLNLLTNSEGAEWEQK